MEPDTLAVPPIPIVAAKREVDLPAVPSFALPRSEPGIHDVRELRAYGGRFLGREVTVTGYVTWIYDCARELKKRGVRLAVAQQQIDEDPSLCDRPKFALGPSPGTPPAAALWVVDVPRTPNKRERAALTPVQLRARPRVPQIAVGEFVAVTGVFELGSPAGERSSDGLLIYRALKHVPPRAAAPELPPPPEPTVVTTPPLRVAVPLRTREASIRQYELCNLAIRNKQIDGAITECRAALTTWEGNHLAWYALGNAYAMRDQWDAASDAYDHAVKLRPDQPMYQMYRGIAVYEAAVRGRAARSHGRDPRVVLRELRTGGGAIDQVLRVHRLAAALAAVEPFASAAVERARLALASAVKLAPALPLAHYYLGRIYREQERPREAAAAFTETIRHDPSLAEPYVALVELYRTWGFAEHSLQVARQGVVIVTGSSAADVWYELGMAEQASGHDAEAIAAFTRSIAIRSSHAQAKFQRGQIYFRIGELEKSRRDLEEFVSAAGPSLDLPKQIASSLLADLARRRARAPVDASRPPATVGHDTTRW